jgi:hypothetical protein
MDLRAAKSEGETKTAAFWAVVVIERLTTPKARWKAPEERAARRARPLTAVVPGAAVRTV